MNLAIDVSHLGKRYRVGEKSRAYKTLRDTVAGYFTKSGGSRRRGEFWALDDVSFEVRQGDTVGVIGHNGAGKSTLLKVLSRITEPTRGSADIYGRIGSLLEVGTGFHQELTGRENIFLSGAILGMKKRDIDRRFDEIVDFAGVERFVDTPIKHYSSGMHLRLAFSVAAHLEPDILLVDEVLAVGDLEFQKKCLGKMDAVAGEGRTILFVSHNMGAIKELCRTALVLRGGRVDYLGPTAQGIRHYTQNVLNIGRENDGAGASGAGWTRVAIAGDERLPNDAPLAIEARLNLTDDLTHGHVHCLIEDAEGNQVVHNFRALAGSGRGRTPAGRYDVRAALPAVFLKPGIYTFYFKLMGETSGAESVKYLSERILLDVYDRTNMFSGKIVATILPPVEWTFAEARTPVRDVV